MSPPPYSGGDICGKTPAFRSKTSRVAKRDDFHSKLLFFVKNKGQWYGMVWFYIALYPVRWTAQSALWNAKSGPKVADGNVAMRTKFSGRLESK